MEIPAYTSRPLSRLPPPSFPFLLAIYLTTHNLSAFVNILF